MTVDKSLNPAPHGRNGEITIPPQIGAFENSVRNGMYGTASVNSEKMGVMGISLCCETLDYASLRGWCLESWGRREKRSLRNPDPG